MRIHLQQGVDARRYNLPAVEEVAPIIPGDGSQNVRVDHDIVLHLQGGGLCHISNLHPSYLSLHYVLFFLMEKKAGILTFHCKILMVILIAPRRSHSSFGMPTGCMYVHQT